MRGSEGDFYSVYLHTILCFLTAGGFFRRWWSLFVVLFRLALVVAYNDSSSVRLTSIDHNITPKSIEGARIIIFYSLLSSEQQQPMLEPQHRFSLAHDDLILMIAARNWMKECKTIFHQLLSKERHKGVLIKKHAQVHSAYRYHILIIILICPTQSHQRPQVVCTYS